MSFQAADQDRRIANVVQLGRVVSIDTATMRVRVQIGDVQTHEIPVAQLASGAIRVHAMPSPGEQVIVFAPGGELGRAFVYGAVPQSSGAVAADEATPTIDLGGGTLHIVGDLTVNGDVIADGISLKNHVHGGVTPGGGDTGVPK